MLSRPRFTNNSTVIDANLPSTAVTSGLSERSQLTDILQNFSRRSSFYRSSFTQSAPTLPTVTISAGDALAAEVNTGQAANPGAFTISRTGSTTTALTVSYTVGGTATKSSDYNNITGNTTATGTITIPVGSASVTLPINVINDTTPESNETVVLTLATNSAYAIGTTNRATVTIADNDRPTVTITASDALAAEVNTGQTANPGVFKISRTGSTTTALTVSYTVGGTATKGSDYNNITGNTTATGTITIPVGAASVTLPINVINDTTVENSETVVLTLATNSAYAIGTTNSATVTIADNDRPTVTITASDPLAAEVNTGQTANPGVFKISRTGSTTTALTVSYTVGGTATKGSDYNNITGNTTATGTITIPVGAASVTLPINVINDTTLENNETVVLTLATNSAYAIGTTNSATVTIADNDRIADPVVARFSPTGNDDIDGLLSPFQYYWNTSANGGVVTYSFYRNTSGSYYSDETVAELSDATKNDIRNILASLSTYINVRFVEVADTSNSYGVIRYMLSNGGGRDFYAYAYFPTSNPVGGDVHLSYQNASDWQEGYGSYGYLTLIHETFHALGLKHPGNYDAGSGSSPGPFLSPEDDNNTNTVMTYNGGGANPVTPMAYDIRALQYLYGAASNNSTATTYNFRFADSYYIGNQFFGTDTADIKQTIWDSGGVDTLDMSNLSSNTYVFDIREGGIITTYSAYYGETYQDRTTGGYYNTTYFGVSLAYNTIIENVINSRGNDLINANSAANTFKGYTLGTYTGNDVYYQTSGADVIELSGYSLSNLTTNISNGSLIVSLGSYGSIEVKDYFTTGSMRFKIGSSYYRYNATSGWQLAPSASIAQNTIDNHEPIVTGGLTAKQLYESEIVTDTRAVIACQCAVCSATRVATKNLSPSTLMEAIGV